MKRTLFLFALLLNLFIANAQDVEVPTITGDTMLCPDTDGTASITNDETYDTYQWYYKYWFSDDDFQAIEGATEASFTYDWYTYDQSLFKVVVTKDGETLESDTIQIDSYAFAGLLISHSPSENVETDPTNGNFLICDGDFIENTVQMPYTIVQWFKDGEPIEGATEVTYTITEPGSYTVEASPEACPNMVETGPAIVVAQNSDCESSGIEEPVIDGDIMLCPDTDGTASITNDENYDSYQWYYKYWFSDDDFQSIEGATEASFTYDWFTYDQALLKVVVTKDGETLESNTIQIDSYAFASLLISHNPSENVETDPTNGDFLICDGDFIENTVQMPYTIVQWFKDGAPIEGATEVTYTITEPGSYTVEASPESCPNMIETSPAIVVAIKSDCDMGVPENELEGLSLINNPVKDILAINNPNHINIDKITIYSLSGKKLKMKTNNMETIDVSGLASGVYFLKIESDNTYKNIKFIKE